MADFVRIVLEARMRRSTTGDWDSGNPAFAISHGPCRTTPSASSSDSRFSDMLFSPPAFAFRSIGWPRGSSSEPLLTRIRDSAARSAAHPFNAYRSSTDKPGSDPAGRELSLSTFTFLLILSVITCCQLMQGRDSEIKPTSSFQRIPVYDTLQ